MGGEKDRADASPKRGPKIVSASELCVLGVPNSREIRFEKKLPSHWHKLRKHFFNQKNQK